MAAGPEGQVLITTRLPASAFAAPARVIPVPGLSSPEAMKYLTARLGYGLGPRFEARDLIEDLDGLPLALALASAVMLVSEQDCAAYRARLAERRPDMKPVPGVSAPVLAAWSMAVDAARDLAPAGLAWTALALAAMLDHHGVPDAVLTSPAACGYITGRPSTGSDADRQQVRKGPGQPGPDRPGHGRRRGNGPDARQRAGRGPGLPARHRPGGGRAGRRERADRDLAGLR